MLMHIFRTLAPMNYPLHGFGLTHACVRAGDGMFKLGAGPHEVWRAILALKPERSGGVEFQPLQAQLVDSARSTISISPMAEAMAVGNATLPDNMHFVYPSMV